jgi:hypothetical protein
MGARADFQTILETILGSNKVYFKPPTDPLDYSSPIIMYKRDWAKSIFATNRAYRHVLRYQVTLISRSADTDSIREALALLPMSTYDRYFTTDNLHHDVFKIFF